MEGSNGQEFYGSAQFYGANDLINIKEYEDEDKLVESRLQIGLKTQHQQRISSNNVLLDDIDQN